MEKERLLYVVKCAKTPYYKVGITNLGNGKVRLKQLQVGCPFKLEFHATYRTIHAKDRERVIHELCEDRKILGEWFELNKEDLLMIKDYCSK